MNVKIIKEALWKHATDRVYSFNKLRDTLHLPPGKGAEIQKLECYKPMMWLMTRFLDMYYERPLTAIRPTVEVLQEKLKEFLDSITIPAETKIFYFHQLGWEGLTFWFLFHVMGWFKNLGSMERNPHYHPHIKQPDEMQIRDIRSLVKRFVDPPEKEFKTIWEARGHEMPGSVRAGEICHKYLLRLFFFTLHYKKDSSFYREPSLKVLRNMTLAFLDQIPWPDDKLIAELALSDSRAVILVAMHDIIFSYYCLPWPEIAEESLQAA